MFVNIGDYLNAFDFREEIKPFNASLLTLVEGDFTFKLPDDATPNVTVKFRKLPGLTVHETALVDFMIRLNRTSTTVSGSSFEYYCKPQAGRPIIEYNSDSFLASHGGLAGRTVTYRQCSQDPTLANPHRPDMWTFHPELRSQDGRVVLDRNVYVLNEKYNHPHRYSIGQYAVPIIWKTYRYPLEDGTYFEEDYLIFLSNFDLGEYFETRPRNLPDPVIVNLYQRLTSNGFFYTENIPPHRELIRNSVVVSEDPLKYLWLDELLISAGWPADRLIAHLPFPYPMPLQPNEQSFFLAHPKFTYSTVDPTFDIEVLEPPTKELHSEGGLMFRESISPTYELMQTIELGDLQIADLLALGKQILSSFGR
jgi:hypothetical protein